METATEQVCSVPNTNASPTPSPTTPPPSSPLHLPLGRSHREASATIARVRGIRDVPHDLSAEVDGQNKLLEGMAREVEATDDRVHAAAARVQTLQSCPYSARNFGKILGPLVRHITLFLIGLKCLGCG